MVKAKSGSIARLGKVPGAGMRGLLKLEQQVGARTDRGFNTAATLNYLKRLSKVERAIEAHHGQPKRLIPGTDFRNVFHAVV